MRRLRHLLLLLVSLLIVSAVRAAVPVLPAPKKVIETDENGARRFHAIRLESTDDPTPYRAVIEELEAFADTVSHERSL